jgi:glyoxylase-like metal-dependent hydrolase (beta-lactamase superfamily II)
MQVVTLTSGRHATHTSLVSDGVSADALLIDPGEESERLSDTAARHELQIVAVVATHAHFDHIAGIAKARPCFHAPFMIGAHAVESLRAERQRALAFPIPALIDEPPAPDHLLVEGEILRVGGMQFEILETPGHWRGDVSLQERASHAVFSGDSLGSGFIFDRNDGCDRVLLLQSIRIRLMTLPDETTIYPEHGPPTTIACERANTPALRL